MHLDRCKLGQNIRAIGECRPVELDVLPCREMAIAAIVAPRDEGELAHLARRQSPIRHGDAQHIGVQLQIDAVHEAQRLELILGQFAREAPRDLIAEAKPAASSGAVRPTDLYSYDGFNNITSYCDAVFTQSISASWTTTPAISDSLCPSAVGATPWRTR